VTLLTAGIASASTTTTTTITAAAAATSLLGAMESQYIKYD
jgi:hypothetical protein